ncbi:MAG: nonstructural protein [Microvirus sp.]|nr:MAG: nonstructural protein [Microvirus sp.]
MAILKVFAVYDSKVQTYAQPFFVPTAAAALRSFADIAKDTTHPIGKHPEDYTLMELGTYDESTGLLESLTTPHSQGVALEFMKVV